MKKVIAAVCFVGVAAVAVQAQGIARLANYEAKEYRRSQQQSGNMSAAVDRAAVQARREYEESQRRQQQQEQTQPVSRGTLPGFGTTALINYEGVAAQSASAPAPAKPTAKRKTKKAKKSSGSAWDYIKASFGCAPYPGETDAQYRARLSGMGAVANQPFK